jgi:hypothetical protein
LVVSGLQVYFIINGTEGIFLKNYINKMAKKITFFLILVMLFSCSEIYFDEPMPFGAKGIKCFNKHLIGKYNLIDSTLMPKQEIFYNEKYFKNIYTNRDSTTLISANISITSKIATYSGNLKFYYNIHTVDTARIILKHNKEKKTYENNFIVFDLIFSDTLINIEKKDKLKIFKKNYYLDKFMGSKCWDIYQLIITNDTIVTLGLTNNVDQIKLSPYLMNKDHLLDNTVHVSDDEFKIFIEKGGFRNKFRFKKA